MYALLQIARWRLGEWMIHWEKPPSRLRLDWMVAVPSRASRPRVVAPYGSWKSPITAEALVTDAVGLDQITADGDVTYWIESRPSEEGRNVIVRRDAHGKIADVTPQPFNARTRVHEYGGRSYTVHGDTIYFANFADQRVYRV